MIATTEEQRLLEKWQKKLWRLRHWNRRFSELYDELRKEIGND